MRVNDKESKCRQISAVSLHDINVTFDIIRLPLPRRLCFCPGPDLAGGRPGAPGGRPGPSGVFGISERDWLSNYRVLKIEEFGGTPPDGGRPGARAAPVLPKSGPVFARAHVCLFVS